ncbi:MAG: peptidyl-prolyl cis-trans isomerase [Pikeienuella sp.]
MIARNFIRSPLLHFFALGALVFVAHAALNDDAPPPAPDAITLSPAEAARLAAQFSAIWSRPPSEEEMEGLMRSWALDEAHVREALALGLDRGDAIIRQRLSLKMRFLAESGAAALIPDDQALQAHLDANIERFETPARFAFEQVLLPEGDDGIEAAAAALRGGANPAGLGKSNMLPARIPPTPAPVIDQMFGKGFHEALAELPLGDWRGPVQGGYGLHMVRLTERSEAVPPPLAEVRSRVEEDWRAARAREMREAFGQDLLDRYKVALPAAAEILAK